MAAKMPSGGKQGWMPHKNPKSNTGLPKDKEFSVTEPYKHKKLPGDQGKQTHKTSEAPKEHKGILKNK